MYRVPTVWQRVSRWGVPVAIVLGVVAVAVSIWALTAAGSKGSTTSALPGDPKMRVCNAFDTVSRGVALQTHNDLGQDPVAQAAVAGNARLALVGGGDYLMRQLDSSTPSQLADAVSAFARDLQDIGINALAGVQNSDPGQAARLAEGDSARKQVADLCK
ncbi:hypothetical protein MANY_25670 [Mycolicibacterium anyangense]|uniref:Alanine and proline rich membrane protein n=1 Tax=Mycolicibacterium anyangense TaxID=1431246 RepID=A0A6N4W5K1_9MYCO|nr:hypothetical protein MANY_25670 [Mycolicibacterium anyangense]